jgi:hypothetical protein
MKYDPKEYDVHANDPETFDIVQVIGSVVLGFGDRSASVEAFIAIAEFDQPGTFVFQVPNEPKRTITVDFD